MKLNRLQIRPTLNKMKINRLQIRAILNQIGAVQFKMTRMWFQIRTNLNKVKTRQFQIKTFWNRIGAIQFNMKGFLNYFWSNTDGISSNRVGANILGRQRHRPVSGRVKQAGVHGPEISSRHAIFLTSVSERGFTREVIATVRGIL